MAKTLVIYYSRKGQNYVNGSIEDLPKGNTEIVAEFIQKAVGADLFEVVTKKAYAVDYTQCTVEAKEELRKSARPELVEMACLPNRQALQREAYHVRSGALGRAGSTHQ